MSDAHPPISLLLERQNRHSRELLDFREGQAQLFRILTRSLETNTRAVEANGRELTGIREELAGLRREVNALAAEQTAPAMRVD
jgi:hypothetical protein